MIIYVKKLLLLALCFLTLPLMGQTFGEADLERLIMNHPMMKNYDSKTGYFKNTDYELHNVENLKADNASMANEIDFIKAKELKNSSKIFEDSDFDEEELWSDIASLSRLKLEYNYKIIKNDNLIVSEGKPGTEKLYPIIDKMCNDIFIPLYNKDKVVLNKLPRYPSNKPELEGKDLHYFWYNPDEKVLRFYLQQAYCIGLIFPRSDKTILFQRPSGDNK